MEPTTMFNQFALIHDLHVDLTKYLPGTRYCLCYGVAHFYATYRRSIRL